VAAFTWNDWSAIVWNDRQTSVEYAADHQIWFFTLYDKDEAADLTTEEKKVLKKAIQAELKARRRMP
jgi:hypothetical protein